MITQDHGEAPDPPHITADFDIWERECPADFTFKHLRTAKLSHIITKNEMEFVKFVLGRSPLLEVMSISLDTVSGGLDTEYGGTLKAVNEVLRFRRASRKVEISFFEGSHHHY